MQKNAGFKSFHTHTLNSIEKFLKDTFEIHTDAHLNRVYTKKDIEKLQTILRLKIQGLNYPSIKDLLKNSNAELEVACTTKDLQPPEKDMVLSPTILDNFKSVVTEIIHESVDQAIAPHVIGMRQEILSLKEQNETLRTVLEKQQEEHFRQIDYKISKWRAEQAFRREKKPWYKKIFS